jgi:hypothetical protein
MLTRVIDYLTVAAMFLVGTLLRAWRRWTR